MSHSAPLLSITGPSQWAGVEEKLGFLGATMALSVGMIGTGIVAFPFGFSLCGYIGGPVAMVFICGLSYLSYDALIRCTDTMHVASYGGLLSSIPKQWEHYTNGALWLVLILSVAAYVIIASHIFRDVALKSGMPEYARFLLDAPILFAIILAMVFPLCLQKTMNGLSVISTYCTCALMLVVGLILFEAFSIAVDDPPGHAAVPTAGTDARSVLMSLPIFGTAMFGHMNISQIYAELKPDLKPRASRVALAACVGAAALYVSIGAAGYAAFGLKAGPDVLTQIASSAGESTAVVVAQAVLASFIVLKTPLLVLPVRKVTLDCILPQKDGQELPLWQHMLLTFVLLLCVYISAVGIPDLSKLLEVIGAVCALPIVFVIPARLSWQLEKPRPVVKCVVMASFGILASMLSLLIASGLL